jgi:hypothetical protein
MGVGRADADPSFFVLTTAFECEWSFFDVCRKNGR